MEATKRQTSSVDFCVGFNGAYAEDFPSSTVTYSRILLESNGGRARVSTGVALQPIQSVALV